MTALADFVVQVILVLACGLPSERSTVWSFSSLLAHAESAPGVAVSPVSSPVTLGNIDRFAKAWDTQPIVKSVVPGRRLDRGNGVWVGLYATPSSLSPGGARLLNTGAWVIDRSPGV